VIERWPTGMGGEDAVPVGKTAQPRVLRILRDCVLEEAFAEARTWCGIDPGVAAMRTADAERLAHILGVLLPDTELPRVRRVEDAE
jgi:hypothetical protein